MSVLTNSTGYRPLVSLITATYCSERTVVDTLRSVNGQTYERIEHLVIDGGSEDNTVQIVRQYGDRVSQIISEPDEGIYDAYNKGLRVTNGEIIGFINSDDYYANDKVIENVVKCFLEYDVDAIYADLVYVESNDSKSPKRYWKTGRVERSHFSKGCPPPHPTLFLRKSVYDSIGHFNTSYRYSGDFEFMLRLFKEEAISKHYLPQVLVHMREGGQTGGNLRSIFRQNQEIFRAMFELEVPFSKFYFVANKMINRFFQRIRAKRTLKLD